MKKIFAILLMLSVLLSLSLTALAAPGSFVSSPTGNSAPTVESFKANDADCTGTLVVTSYGKRNELPQTYRTLLEKAYGEIVNSSDLTKLNADLAKLASDRNIKGSDLAVSDLFNVHVTDCDAHDGHYDFDIVLNAGTLNRFVGLLQMNLDGEWEYVSGAEVLSNGTHLKFSLKSLSPLAIVVNTASSGTDSPPTSDNWMVYVYAGIAVVSAGAFIALWVTRKKSGENND
ncbi:MAG: hypothetical protein J6B54_02180 [Clostridia bacterium]|nr:hypothetical protein [Clostridia bacterium]